MIVLSDIYRYVPHNLSWFWMRMSEAEHGRCILVSLNSVPPMIAMPRGLLQESVHRFKAGRITRESHKSGRWFIGD